MEKQGEKYRCLIIIQVGEAKEITTLYYAQSDREAQGRVVVFIEMWLGMFVKAENIEVYIEPSVILNKQSHIVNANIVSAEQRHPAATGWYIRESEYQELIAKDEKNEKDAFLEQLKSADLKRHTV